MEKSINQFIWKYSSRQQLVLAAITLAYFPTLYGMLELPKIIINQAIENPRQHLISGMEISPIQFLVMLSLLFLFLYTINGLIKLVINIKKGVLGERMIRRLRYSLIEQTLRFPIQRFRGVSQGEIVSQITSEAEPLGGYISEAITLPLFQGGTMLTILAFMFIQNIWLGLVSIALIPLQILIIPKLQRQVNILSRERVRSVRHLSEHIGETVNGAQAIRVHGVQRYVLAGFSTRLNELFDIRYKLYKKKFFIKFLNNFINQLTPFLFYMVGGTLVIQGQLSLGALVAAIAAYKDMVAPWKELLKFYQMQQDAKIKYEQLVEQFDLEEIDESNFLHDITDSGSQPLFPIQFKNVVTEEDGNRVLDNFQLKFDRGEHLAIVDSVSDRRSHIAELILTLRKPDYGSIQMGDRRTGSIPGSEISRRLAYQPSTAPMFNTSMYENVLLGIKHVPISNQNEKQLSEALRSGNSIDNFDSEWLDYSSYQFSNSNELNDWYLRAMKATGADKSILRRGLFQHLSDEQGGEQAAQIVKARPLLFESLKQQNIKVKYFNEQSWCTGLSIAENLAFGKLIEKNVSPGEVLYSTGVATVLSENGFDGIIEQIGRQIAHIIYSGLTNEYYRDSTMQEFNIKSDQQAADIQETTWRLTKRQSHQINDQDRTIFIQLFLNIVIENHKNIRLPGAVISKIMFLRDEIDSVMDWAQRSRLQRFEYDQYHPGLTVLENLVFGLNTPNVNTEQQEKLLNAVEQFLKQEDLSRDIMLLTLKSSESGVAGSRLSLTARQNLSLASALIKQPDILVVNDGLSSYDEDEQLAIKDNIRELLPDTAILWLTSELDRHTEFDRVITLE